MRKMPKGGSGFRKEAARQAGILQRGSSSWRFGSGRDRYTKEITDLFKRMYRSGITIQRDARGRMIGFNGTDKALIQANDRMFELAERMAKDVQIYNQSADETYANMRRTWGKAIFVSSKDKQEFMRSMRSGDTMLINPRGRRGIASDAATRAAETGWQTNQVNNASILAEANRQMNATRNAIWQNTDSSNVAYYTNELAEQLINRYAKTERAASTRRKS